MKTSPTNKETPPVASLIETVGRMTPEERQEFQEAFERNWFDASKKHYGKNPSITPLPSVTRTEIEQRLNHIRNYVQTLPVDSAEIKTMLDIIDGKQSEEPPTWDATGDDVERIMRAGVASRSVAMATERIRLYHDAWLRASRSEGVGAAHGIALEAVASSAVEEKDKTIYSQQQMMIEAEGRHQEEIKNITSLLEEAVVALQHSDATLGTIRNAPGTTLNPHHISQDAYATHELVRYAITHIAESTKLQKGKG